MSGFFPPSGFCALFSSIAALSASAWIFCRLSHGGTHPGANFRGNGINHSLARFRILPFLLHDVAFALDRLRSVRAGCNRLASRSMVFGPGLFHNPTSHLFKLGLGCESFLNRRADFLRKAWGLCASLACSLVPGRDHRILSGFQNRGCAARQSFWAYVDDAITTGGFVDQGAIWNATDFGDQLNLKRLCLKIGQVLGQLCLWDLKASSRPHLQNQSVFVGFGTPRSRLMAHPTIRSALADVERRDPVLAIQGIDVICIRRYTARSHLQGFHLAVGQRVAPASTVGGLRYYSPYPMAA